jgi:altronate dehydratase small subunit
MPPSAIIIDSKDNVATALRPINSGETADIQSTGGMINQEVSQLIPFGHKFALKTIEKGNPVIKYGEVIGLANTNITPGEHVHVHNTEGQKGRGDKN